MPLSSIDMEGESAYRSIQLQPNDNAPPIEVIPSPGSIVEHSTLLQETQGSDFLLAGALSRDASYEIAEIAERLFSRLDDTAWKDPNLKLTINKMIGSEIAAIPSRQVLDQIYSAILWLKLDSLEMVGLFRIRGRTKYEREEWANQQRWEYFDVLTGQREEENELYVWYSRRSTRDILTSNIRKGIIEFGTSINFPNVKVIELLPPPEGSKHHGENTIRSFHSAVNAYNALHGENLQLEWDESARKFVLLGTQCKDDDLINTVFEDLIKSNSPWYPSVTGKDNGNIVLELKLKDSRLERNFASVRANMSILAARRRF
jgi:hypothetical protein